MPEIPSALRGTARPMGRLPNGVEEARAERHRWRERRHIRPTARDVDRTSLLTTRLSATASSWRWALGAGATSETVSDLQEHVRSSHYVTRVTGGDHIANMTLDRADPHSVDSPPGWCECQVKAPRVVAVPGPANDMSGLQAFDKR